MPTTRIQRSGAARSFGGRRNPAVAAALVVILAPAWLLAACTGEPTTVVMDDFESGSLARWQAVGGGAGGWFVYSNGDKAPDPAQSDPNVPFHLARPPQGTFAAATDMNGPGTRILYRDLRLDGQFRIDLTVHWAGTGPLNSPPTLDYQAAEANEQFRIDLIAPTAPIDSVAVGDVLTNIFATSPADPVEQQPTEVSTDLSAWQGQTVRLRLAQTDNRGRCARRWTTFVSSPRSVLQICSRSTGQ